MFAPEGAGFVALASGGLRGRRSVRRSGKVRLRDRPFETRFRATRRGKLGVMYSNTHASDPRAEEPAAGRRRRRIAEGTGRAVIRTREGEMKEKLRVLVGKPDLTA